MKTKLLIVLIFICSSLKGQVIGDHLNTIRAKDPGGELEKTDSGYRYTVTNDNGHLEVYFLNANLICTSDAIKPSSRKQLQGYVETFNNNWVVINSHEWRYYGSNNFMLSCVLTYIDNVGDVFYIKKYEE